MKHEGTTLIIDKPVVLPFDMYEPQTDIEKIIIASDFDFDLDRGPHFSAHPKLKEFEVTDSSCPFVAYGGVLYLKLNEATRGKDMIQGFNDEDGLALVCCPPCIPDKDLVIHDDCLLVLR